MKVLSHEGVVTYDATTGKLTYDATWRMTHECIVVAHGA